MFGPFSGLIFIAGVIMFFIGRNPNNDEMFSYKAGDPKDNRIMCMINGIIFVIAAVVMWIYMAVNGDPDPPPDLNSYINKTSSN